MKTALWLALAIVVASPAGAVVYDAHPCTLGVDCFDITHTTPVTPGPTNADFQNFYGTELGLDLSGDTFTWTGKTAPTGDWFGMAHDFNAEIHAAYLWHDGAIICCTVDEPYEIIDGNVLGFFVGIDPSGGANFNQPFYPGFIATVGGPYELTPYDFELSGEAKAFLSPDGGYHTVEFVGAPDGYGFLAHWDFGYFNLTPASGPPLAQAPEPASALILVPLLALLGRRVRRP